jgi:hypothetical protein
LRGGIDDCAEIVVGYGVGSDDAIHACQIDECLP